MKNCIDVKSTYGCSKIPNVNVCNSNFIHTTCKKKILATNVSLFGCNFGDRNPKKKAHKNKNCNPKRLDYEV